MSAASDKWLGDPVLRLFRGRARAWSPPRQCGIGLATPEHRIPLGLPFSALMRSGHGRRPQNRATREVSVKAQTSRDAMPWLRRFE